MSDIVTLSPDLILTIPKSLIEAQNWRPGQELVFMVRHGSVMVVPVPSRDALFSIAKGSDPTGYRDRDDRY